MGGAIMAHTIAGFINSGRRLGEPKVLFVPISKRPQSEYGYVLDHKYVPFVRGRKALLLDDVLNTGATAVSCCSELQQAGAIVLAAGFLVDRNYHTLPMAVPTHALWTMDRGKYWQDKDCPLCREGVPITVF
jgi:orotate phosphoribosyltransferase